MERLRERSRITSYQKQLGKEFEKIKKDRAAEVLTYVYEKWKRLKEGIVETAKHTIGYQPKPDNRGWVDEECKTAIDEKNEAYKKWIDKPVSYKRLEYERLRKTAHKICKSKKCRRENCIKKTEAHQECIQRGWFTKGWF